MHADRPVANPQAMLAEADSAIVPVGASQRVLHRMRCVLQTCCAATSQVAGRKAMRRPSMPSREVPLRRWRVDSYRRVRSWWAHADRRSEEHTSELQSRFDLVCRLLLEKKK